MITVQGCGRREETLRRPGPQGRWLVSHTESTCSRRMTMRRRDGTRAGGRESGGGRSGVCTWQAGPGQALPRAWGLTQRSE